MKRLFLTGLCVAGAITFLSPTTQAEDYSFQETFSAPPLTAGTADVSFEDGWVDGDHGWNISESFSGAYANFGQRADDFVVNTWPGGTYSAIGNVRNTGGTASAGLPLMSDLQSGRVNIALTDVLSNSGVFDLYLVGPARTQYSGVLQDEVGVWLRFGGLSGASNGDKFEVIQRGGLDTVLITGDTKTVDNRDLLWKTDLDGNNTNGNYAVLTVDFNARSNTSSIVVTTVDAAGSASSTARVELPFNLPVNSINRAIVASIASPDGSFGSLSWMGGFSVTGTFAQPRAENFGQQWVRDNPFTIMGAAHERGTPAPFDVDQYRDANMSVVFSNKDAAVAQAAGSAGVPWHGHGTVEDFNNTYRFIPNATGYMVWDEPYTQADVQAAALAAQRMHEQHPDVLTYVNAMPYFVFPSGEYNYDQYLDDLVHVVKTDVLMFDLYPFRTDGTTDRNGFFFNAMAVRNKALQNDLPYWAWLQSYKSPGDNVRTPSASDTRFNAFTLLTLGYTGLNYFMYDNETADFHGDFFDAAGNPTPFYYDAAASDAEVANIGRSLRFMTSNNVYLVNGSSPGATGGIASWTIGANGDDHLINVAVDISNSANQGSDKDGLIGFFTDDNGQQYFMLTNLYHGTGLLAADSDLSFVLTFDSGVNSIWLLNRLTGVPEEITLIGHSLHWTLPGGTGDLFKYDNGNFAGVPEPASLAPLALTYFAMRRRRGKMQSLGSKTRHVVA